MMAFYSLYTQEDSELPTADIVIGADTIVVKDECVLEKPRDKEHALAMLQQLNGQSHYVLTGVQIMYKINDTVERIEFVERTQVQFSQMDLEIIQACRWPIFLLAMVTHVYCCRC